MAVSRQSVAQTLADVISWRPVLEPVLRAFEPLLTAQAELAAHLAENLRAHTAGMQWPDPWSGEQAERARLGVSLLAGAAFTGTGHALRSSAARLLPLLGGMEAVKPHMPALNALFWGPADAAAADDLDALAIAVASDDNEALTQLAETMTFGNDEALACLAEAVVSGSGEVLARLAGEHGLDPAVLDFVAGIVVAPLLRALAQGLLNAEGEAPWERENIWREGYCPVCGALPSMAWLDKRQVDEKNAFLAGGGGKKHLHCGLCGANWTFRRNACPSCGQEGSEVMELLRESGPAHGERLDWCTRCKVYCPTVDLRERESVPDLDALALGMMHLDMVAARKKLRPLRRSFWNTF